MTRMEASRILGLRSDATEDKIKDAHRRIMIANHPDSGGSSYIAAKVSVRLPPITDASLRVCARLCGSLVWGSRWCGCR